MAQPQPTPPGWYQDPTGQHRYWDGQQWQQPLPAKSKNNTAIVVLAVVVLFFGGCAALVGLGASSDSGKSQPTSVAQAGGGPANTAPARAAAPSRSAAPAAPGAPVRDGQFEFRVTDVASAKTIGDNQFLQTTAQGVFVIFTLQVTNTGNEARRFSAMAQKLIDSSGRKYDASTSADTNLNRMDSLGQINPGNTVKVMVAFDVPPDLKMNALELHDSLFSGGVLTPASAG